MQNNTLYDYAISFLGVPYVWGGNSHGGIDCSGFCYEVLRSVGMGGAIRPTAQSLMQWLKANDATSCINPEFGAIAFFGKPTEIIHCAFVLNEKQMIEAAFGLPSMNTVEKARAAGAEVIISMINRRNDLVDIVMPNYEFKTW